MKISDLLKRSGKNLRSAKIRTVLTSLAIAVGGFTLVLTLGAGNGLRDYTSKLIESNFDPTELMVGKDKEITNAGTPSTEPKEYDDSVSSLDFGTTSLQIKRVTKEDIEQIKQLPAVESVRENYRIDARYITRENQKKYTLSVERFNPAQKPEVKAGNLPGGSDDLPKGSILLPDSYLEVLGFNSAEEAIGKNVSIHVRKGLPEFTESTGRDTAQKTIEYAISAVTKRSATSIAGGQLPVYVSGPDAKILYDFTSSGTPDYEKYTYVNVRIKNGTDEDVLSKAKSDLESQGFYVQSSKDVQKTVTQFVNILQGMVLGFGAITLIASIFGIINTQYISVLERTREIGLMKALGMRSRDVKLLFMFEASWIGFLGGLIGSVLAVILGILINPWISEKLDLGDGNSLIIFNPLQIVMLIAGLVLVATVAGILPARKASKMDPIEALRTE